MSDSSGPRRQPPSPLVFSPETVLPPIVTQASSQRHGSGSNTVSMPFIKRHVTRRLRNAKQECDKELQRITNAITTFFEEQLREGDLERGREIREPRRRSDSRATDSMIESSHEPFIFGDLKAAFQTDETGLDSGFEVESEIGRRSRPLSSIDDSLGLNRWSSSPGLLSSSSSSSPSSLRRQSTLPQDKLPLVPSVSSPGITFADSSVSRPSSSAVPPTRGSQGAVSRRLSRTIHIPPRPSHSTHSSRSTSRSRSPLPRRSHTVFVDSTMSNSSNRRSSRILIDDPIDPMMMALYEIIAVATDITEMSINQLTCEPKICSSLVQRVQNIGKTWDEHPDWQGRNWFVQVLLAVASLSRVVEWWEAEKQFWNFEDDDEQAEPFTFLLKPADETIPTPTVPSLREHEKEFSPKTFTDDDEGDIRLSLHPTNQDRNYRDEYRKAISFSSTLVSEPVGHSQMPPRIQTSINSARILAKERLRLQVEKAQSHNIVLELSLDGDRFLWVNYAWSIVIGSDPENVVGVSISHLLHSSDSNVFKTASKQLLADDSHTVEVRFKLRVELESNAIFKGFLFQEMEGKGMLMIDPVDSQPTHTMWVIKPVGSPVVEQLSLTKFEEVEDGVFMVGESKMSTSCHELGPVAPFLDSRRINTTEILCRICECNIPEWFFEKHNETCNEVHKLEADVSECNESMVELRNTVRELRLALEKSFPVESLEYRGVPIFSSVSSSNSSPLLLFRPPLVSRMQRNGIRKMQRRLLEHFDDILQVALEISMPALKEDESKEPIERQRLLSPGSELKIVRVRKWTKPVTEDQGLAQLANDIDMLMRAKLDNVSRMQNTIKYAEKVRQEWEEKVEQILLPTETYDVESEESDNNQEQLNDNESKMQNASENRRESTIVGGDDDNSFIPETTVTSTAPFSIIKDSQESHFVTMASSSQSQGMGYSTRSSTPSSMSSPLARAVPIVAFPEPTSVYFFSTTSDENLKTRKSIQNFEPRVTITPPISPSFTMKVNTNLSNRRLSVLSPTASVGGPLSPRLPSVAPSSRPTPTSIKDFDIIKPISKGAFGSVFLAKKKITGDYYAVKVLKKADMIAKNQITNVKAERMILMNQAESPFVAKLYFTFQSKDNLYLVMEYLNGGDCAALIKSLGSLPEDWTRNYIAEVVLGLEYLHKRGIVHRDLKPDNLLIDHHGHLKLTDFGLSRIGLLGRQTREAQSTDDRLRSRAKYSPGSRPPSMDSAYMSSPLIHADVVTGGSYFNQRIMSISQNVSQPFLSSGPPTDDISESSGSESLSGFFLKRSIKAGESPLQSFANELTNDLRSYSTSGPGTPPSVQKFVGTPDYLAPESILGIAGDDAAVDWWALGVITYEFLYGFPPFHDEIPEKVFENILSGHVNWHEEWIDFSNEALDFMKKLLAIDPGIRLGVRGAEDVKAHPFFSGIDWEKITISEAAFVPHVSDPESTDYFDPRGASHQIFHDDEMIAVGQSAASPGSDVLRESGTKSVQTTEHDKNAIHVDDGFGAFSFKNLPVLKQANDDVIRKLRTDQMVPIVHALNEPANILTPHRRSISQRMKKPPSVVTSLDNKPSLSNPPSPATSASSVASSPSLGSIAPSTPGSSGSHIRKFSELSIIDRFKSNQAESDSVRRNSMPSRLRTASISTNEDQNSVSEHWPAYAGQHRLSENIIPPAFNTSSKYKTVSDPENRAVTCLLAEDNPITAKIIETLLNRLGCHCIVVADGSEAISVALGDIKFDCILMDLHMPLVDGESAARYIKSTMNKNTSVPIIAISAYSGQDTNVASNLFAASLAKPVQKPDLITTMRQLGFKTSTHQDGATTKVVATS